MKRAKKVAKRETVRGAAAKPESPPEIELPGASPERRWLWAISALLGAGVFAAGTAIALQRSLPFWEERIFRLVNSWPDSFYPVFLAGTIAPESLWLPVVAVAVTFFLKLYRLSWQLAAGTIIGYGLGYAAKELIGRGRPLEYFNDISIRANEAGMGFPSGHTMIITVIVLTLFPYLPKGWRWGAVVLIPLMALSRVYLGVHVPLDVVGGFALGLFVVALLRCLPARLRDLCRLD